MNKPPDEPTPIPPREIDADNPEVAWGLDLDDAIAFSMGACRSQVGGIAAKDAATSEERQPGVTP